MVKIEPSGTISNRRNILRAVGVAAGGLTLGTSIVAGDSFDPDRSEPINSRDHSSGPHQVRAEPKEGNTDVLLIKDCNPWGETTNEDVLNEFGISYEVINSDTFGDHPLDVYSVIIIPSTQEQSYYDNLYAEREKLAGFVDDGDVLLAHATDNGHPCTTVWTDSFLPEGVTKENQFHDSIEIVDQNHPMVENLTEDDLSGWFYSTHGWFTNLSSDVTIVMGVAGNPVDNPTYIEYPYGDGTVFTTMMTLEWGGGDRTVLENEISHVLDFADVIDTDCIPRREAGRDTPEEDICEGDHVLSRDDDRSEVGSNQSRRRASR